MMSPMTNVPPPDQDARDRIARDLGTTFLVEAGAGSGKTKSLVDRMIALLAEGRTQIDTLAAVTFTRKASAQLRGRFQVELERRRLAEKDPGRRARLDAALSGLERSFIGTIHSFCARLLRERPVEAGVDPEFQELEEHEDRILLEACWDEYQAKARIENAAALRGLEEAGLETSELGPAFKALAAYPDVEPVAGRTEPPDLGPAQKALEELLALARTLVPAERPEKGRDGLQTALVRSFRRKRNLGFEDGPRLMETIELFEKESGVTKNRWASKDAAETMQAAVRAFREDVALPALCAWREFRHTKALAFLRPALAYYEGRRRAEGQLNFQDQLMLAAGLLKGNPEVRGYFRRRFHPILVDEFQDTDPIQAEILFLLAGEGGNGAEADWTRFVPAPGSLFLVGDPKQSIYRFRRADIDIYRLVKRLIESSGGETLELCANFRSLGSVTSWINPLFEPGRGGLFPAEANDYQAGFMALDAARRPGPQTLAGVFKVTVPAVPRHAKEPIAEYDSRRVGEFIAWALDGNLVLEGEDGGPRPAEPRDFLVLFRYKDRMNRYARRLEELGIPFEISGSDAFADNGEIGEVMNLLRALDDPDDPVAAVAVLRGLFFGLSDQELLEHRAAGGEFAYLGDAELPSGTARVRRAFGVLKAWRDTAARLPPSAAVEAILQSSGLLNHLVTAEMGSSRAGNVLKLVEILRARESEDMTSFAAAVEFMEEWAGVQAVEEMNLAPGGRNAVRLMNLHKAKGLEAPVVWLANPAGVKDFEPDRHVRWTDGTPQGHFRFTKPAGFQTKTVSQPIGWQERAAEELIYEEAEENRLMYVAATRARDILVVSAYAGDLGERKSWGPLEAGFEGIPELPEHPRPLPEAALRRSSLGPKAGIVRPDEASRGMEALRRRQAGASRAAEIHETVTSLVRRDHEPPEWARGGLGTWGTEVHSLLKALGESWPRDAGEDRPAVVDPRKLSRMARDVLVAAGWSSADPSGLAGLVAGIVGSGFWRRAMRAERRFFEVPFALAVGPGRAGYRRLRERVGLVPLAGGQPVVPVPDAPVLLSGAIDLLFEEADGWILADYKTDRLPPAFEAAGAEARERALDVLVDHYRPQVELYAQSWAEMSGEKVKEAGLYFTALDRWVRIVGA